ncbi:MAG: zf-HC2 domain-containing protein [Clostridium sp.]|nr:zf-HC2 domain-containing protein [Clostridium sp.]MCM1173262.1 zf-HC2 domain-containing protein [Clostridium sp.]MCM1209916.1 zf-HC2 domain-containing protein [Ruminococcus sp.]
MEQKIECNYVKDLLPLYIDEIVSDETKNQITEHLGKCDTCKAVYQDMQKEIADVRLKDIDSRKNFVRQTKRMLLLNIVNILLGLAIAICYIVNRAVNHGFTWFPIAAVSILYGMAILNVPAKSRQHKMFNCMIAISVGLIILLATIQFAGYYLFNKPHLWLFKYGLPIAFLWLAILWLPVLLGRFCKVGVFDLFGILFLGSIVGNYATKIILGDIASREDLLDGTLFLQNGLGLFIGAIVCIVIERIRKLVRNGGKKPE